MMIACFIVVTALFYELFKPVNRNVSLLAAFFSLIGCAAQTFSFVFYIAPLIVLQDAPHLGAFKAEQLQAMALMFFKLFAGASGIGSAFFGFYCLLIGYLVFRSGFLPRILGVLGEGSLMLWLLAIGVNAPQWNQLTAPQILRTTL